MRSILVLLLLGGAAAADPLWDAELRLGYGFELASGDGMTAPHSAPLTVEGIAAFAVQEEPKLYGYGGFVVETLDRNSIGATGGIQLAHDSLRARIGGLWLFAPYTLWGANASAGACKPMGGSLRMCGDLALTEYFAGTDLVKGHAVTQLQLVFSVVIDGS